MNIYVKSPGILSGERVQVRRSLNIKSKLEITLEHSFFHLTLMRFAYDFFLDKKSSLSHDFPSLMGVIYALPKSSDFL